MAFVDKMKTFFDKSVEASKNAFEKAGDAVQDFGDKSVTRIEIKKLEAKLEKQYAAIGKLVYETDLDSLKNNESFAKLKEEAEFILKEIETKKSEINSQK